MGKSIKFTTEGTPKNRFLRFNKLHYCGIVLHQLPCTFFFFPGPNDLLLKPSSLCSHCIQCALCIESSWTLCRPLEILEVFSRLTSLLCLSWQDLSSIFLLVRGVGKSNVPFCPHIPNRMDYSHSILCSLGPAWTIRNPLWRLAWTQECYLQNPCGEMRLSECWQGEGMWSGHRTAWFSPLLCVANKTAVNQRREYFKKSWKLGGTNTHFNPST